MAVLVGKNAVITIDNSKPFYTTEFDLTPIKYVKDALPEVSITANFDGLGPSLDLFSYAQYHTTTLYYETGTYWFCHRNKMEVYTRGMTVLDNTVSIDFEVVPGSEVDLTNYSWIARFLRFVFRHKMGRVAIEYFTR